MDKKWNWEVIEKFFKDKNHQELFKLLDHVEIKDKNNKTLLMFAVEYDNYMFVSLLIDRIRDRPELINARDDFGFHAVNFSLPEKKFGGFRYVIRRTSWDQGRIMEKFIEAGANVNAMVNQNPDTLLVNVSAFRCFVSLLKVLCNFEVIFYVNAQPLKYFLVPFEDFEDSEHLEEIEDKREESLKIILQFYALRREFGLFVHEEEIKIMEKLIADQKIEKIVQNFGGFVDFLKKEEIKFGDRKIQIYDLVGQIFDSKKLKLLARDQEFVEEFEKFYERVQMNRNYKFDFKLSILKAMKNKIVKSWERRKLMEKVEEISELLKVIPLPYEIVLQIFEYFDNYNLEKFVNSFYQF